MELFLTLYNVFFSYFNQVNVRRIKNTESIVSVSLFIKFNINLIYLL